MSECLGLSAVPEGEPNFDEAIAKIKKIQKFQGDVLDLLVENEFTYEDGLVALLSLACAISEAHDEVIEEEEENEKENEKGSC